MKPHLVGLDLHIHSALSPCGGEEMAPPAVLLTAERLGLATIGVVDHSSAGNADAFLSAAQAFAVHVLVGLEIESVEGVHLLALFDNAAAARALEAEVAPHLPARPNRPDILGDQWLLDEYGDRTGSEQRLLAVACDLPLETLAQQARHYGGLAIPAHVDRRGNGLLPTLGFVPPRLRVEFLEVSRNLGLAEARQHWPDLVGRPLIRSSDAHYLADIGSARTLVPAALARPRGPLQQWAEEVAQSLR